MIFYDFEVFKYDWLVVFIIPEKNETIIIQDAEKLNWFYTEHKDEIFVGYNSRGYDQYIFKGILLGLNQYQISKFIIDGNKGWQFSREFNKIQLYNFDIKTTNHSLKELEAFMGNDIQETSVDFDIDRNLTETEIDETIKYCIHDVEQTKEVFENRAEEYTSQISLLKMFNQPVKFISKTKPQLSAIILGAEKTFRNDEFQYTFPDTLCLNKYNYVLDWFKRSENKSYENELQTNVSGVSHVFGWGGLHGAIEQYQTEGIILSCDVASLYPALMIEYNLLSRNVKNPKKYREIRDKRLQLKREKNKLEKVYKIVLNSTYGASKDKYNSLYDPCMANSVCIAGQLLLLDLIEKLEPYWKLIQTNTDGLFGIVQSATEIDAVRKIAAEWEQRTRLQLEWEEYTKIIQKDVNNYIAIQKDGSYKTKGAYVKKLNKLDNDLPILNKALVDFFVKGIAVEKTILECEELIMFQKVSKLTSKYKQAIRGKFIKNPMKRKESITLYGTYQDTVVERHNELDGKCFRTFASTKDELGIFKIKQDGSIAKVPNTADRCYIDNSDIKGKSVPTYLDKQWYINLANERIKEFIGGNNG